MTSFRRPLEEAEAYEHVGLVEEFGNPQEAMARSYAAPFPEHAHGAFTVGRWRLKQGESVGVAEVERAMRSNGRFRSAGYDLLYGHYLEKGRDGPAEEALQEYRRHEEQLAMAQAQRAALKRKRQTRPHGLSSEAIARQIQRISPVRLWRPVLSRSSAPDFPGSNLGRVREDKETRRFGCR